MTTELSVEACSLSSVNQARYKQKDRCPWIIHTTFHNARGPYPATSLGPVRNAGLTRQLLHALQKAGSAASMELCTRRISRVDPYGERNPHRVGTDILVGICRGH